MHLLTRYTWSMHCSVRQRTDGKWAIRLFPEAMAMTVINRALMSTLAFSPCKESEMNEQQNTQDDRVVAPGSYTWAVKATGRTMESGWAEVFTVRNGKVVGFREFANTAAAAKADQPGFIATRTHSNVSGSYRTCRLNYAWCPG